VRRLAVLAVFGALVAGCGGETTASPTPETVEGQQPPSPQPQAQGDPAAGKAVFESKGCNGCHTFTPADSTSQTGPDLDKLSEYAEKADQPLDEFTRESIVNPDGYIEEGFPENVMPPWSGTEKELADLVAFLTRKT
jgi:mono/diheme cytochrome c family protein